MSDTLDIDIRSLEDEERIVTGLAVPWNEIIDIGFTKEAFARGSVSVGKDTKLFFNHKDPIGRVIDGVDSEEGLLIRAKISKTQQGNDVIQLIRDGVVTGMSIGFTPETNHIQDGVTTRVKAKAHEVSLVGIPAYSQAKILDYRSATENDSETQTLGDTSPEYPQTEETNNMEERNMTTNENDISSTLDEIREDILTLQRNAVVTVTEPVLQFRSYGEYVKAYVAGDETARTMFRAYTGGTSADSVFQDGWVGDKVRIVNKPRKVLNAFGTATLPAEGLNVEYAKINANTTQVAVQAAEGDTLVTGKVSVTTATAPVKTYGGYTEMSRQEIERANVNILDKAFEAMASKYATATNSAVRAALVAATLPTVNIASLATAKGKDWLGAVVDAATALDTYDYTLDTIVVSSDVFKAVATLADGADRPLLYTSNPSNNIGSVAGLSATLAGVPLVVDPGAAAKTIWFASKQALTSYESAGAPLRLNDGDITNLSNTYSVYGYLAVALHDVNGVVEGVIA